jgi:hypothetical protein
MPVLNFKAEILIDKISINFHEPDRSTVAKVAMKLREAIGSAFPGSVVRRSIAYSAFVLIPIPLNDPTRREKLVLQADPYDLGRSSYRIEFNPSKVGPQGVADLDLILTSVLGVSAATFLGEGKISRLDAAVDIPDLTVEDVIVRSKSQRKHGFSSDQKGRPVTAYLGGAKSNRTVTYDKAVGRNQSPVLRLERRILPKCLGRDLPSLADPFSKLVLVRIEPLTPLLAPIAPTLFFDSARMRGINRALSSLPSSQRKAIDKALKEPGITIIGDDIWKAWPEALQSSGLASYVVPTTQSPIIDTTATIPAKA